MMIDLTKNTLCYGDNLEGQRERRALLLTAAVRGKIDDRGEVAE